MGVKRPTYEQRGKMVEKFREEIQKGTQADEALEASETRYRRLFEAAQDGILILNTDTGEVMDVNPFLIKLLGYSHAEFVGKKIWEIGPFKDREKSKAVFQELQKKGYVRYESLPLETVDGQSIEVEFVSNVYSVNHTNVIQCNIRNITDRKRAEKLLSKETEWKNLLLWLYEKAPQLTDKELYDYVLEEAVRLSDSTIGFFHLVADDQKTVTLTTWNSEALKNCTASYQIDQAGKWVDCFRLKRPVIYNDILNSPDQKGLPEGHTPVRRFMSIPVMEGDKVRIIFGVGNKTDEYNEHDVMQLQLVSNDLQGMIRQRRAEEETRRLAHENAIIAEIGRIISSTLNIEEVYERFAEEVKKLIPFDRIGINIINPQDQSLTIAYVSGHDISDRRPGDHIPLAAGTISGKLLKHRSSILIQTDKEEEWAERFPLALSTFQAGIQSMLSIPLFSHGQVIGGFHLESLEPQAYTEGDLKLGERVSNQIAGAIANAQLFAEHERSETEKMSLQEQLRQSQKMEAVGRLAGGVAHDFNNLLTVISVQSQLALRELQEADPLKEKLKDIEQATDRAANLTRQLLAFGRRQILEMKVVNLNIILNDLEKMLRRVIGEDIEFKTVFADDLGMVKVDPGQMEQVLMNLVVNAKDAMPQGGKLSLETSNGELDEEYTRSHLGMMPGAYVMLSTTDTGIGMSKEIKEQIFDPFFTTKEKGKGTGLGLSTVFGIVKQSGGDIYVYSEPNQGTTFKIYLPRVFELPEELKKEVPLEKIPQGNETLLLVEDDPTVRRLAVDILRRQGYTMLEAADGGEALVICEKEKRPIDLILTDIVMPRIGGPQLIERLKQVRNDFKALYMTGYTDETIVHHGILDKTVNLIHKPFTIEKLVRKVREVLDKNSKPAV